MKKGGILILIFLILFLNQNFFIKKTMAAGLPTIIITEFQNFGVSDADDFYRAIYNTDTDIDLAANSYRIERSATASSNPGILIRIGITDDGTFPGGTMILAKSYYLIARSGASAAILAQADAIGTRNEFTLGNSNSIYLGTGAIDNKDDLDVKDFIIQDENLLTSNVGQSIGRKWDTSFAGYLSSETALSALEIETPTPKLHNQTYVTQTIIYSDKVLINEIFPAPGSLVDWDSDGVADSNDEWIELINLDDSEVDLSGWMLDDVSDGGSSPFTISYGTKISPDGFKIFYKSITGLILNNSSDSVTLIDPNNKVVDQYSYASAQTDKSFSRDSNSASSSWVTNYPPSPGAPNQAPQNQYPVANAGSNISNAKIGETLNFNGSSSYDNDGAIVGYTWNFGDGSTGSNVTTTHSYSTAGTYQVVLTVRDNSGATSTSSITVTVINIPVVNSTPPYQNQYSNDVKITEILPNPSGSNSENEYIKIYNSSTKELNLRNWSLDDEDGGSKPYVIDYDLIIKPNSSLTFYSADTKILLNNDGDQARLFDSDKKIISQVEYSEKAPADAPYVLENSKWVWKGVESDLDTNDSENEISSLSGSKTSESVINKNEENVANTAKPDLKKIAVNETPLSTIVSKSSSDDIKKFLEPDSIVIDFGEERLNIKSETKTKTSMTVPDEPSSIDTEKKTNYPSPVISFALMLAFIFLILRVFLPFGEVKWILKKILPKYDNDSLDIDSMFKKD